MSAQRRRALLSVFDKNGLDGFAKGLVELGFELISTGGTARALRDAGLAVTDVSEVTGFPEIMDGRVKTLHPAIHGGLLARADIDSAVAAANGIELIELLAVNLYPFEAVTAEPTCTLDTAIENIDIGGPAMLRAAAKNHARVTVVVDSDDYVGVLERLRQGSLDIDARRRLAIKAFRHTARYDSMISSYLAARTAGEDDCPPTLLIAAQRSSLLRYGENPHQAAALYRLSGRHGGTVAHAEQLQGKALSYNNLADADAAVQCAKAFKSTACVIVKHANPCGVALAGDATTAYQMAYACDPTSAFGGVIAFNAEIDEPTARAIVDQQFAEVIAAPRISSEARKVFAAKTNLRVLELGPSETAEKSLEIRTIEGAVLAQQKDIGSLADVALKVVSHRAPSESELEDLRFAWTVAKYVKSNAIVYAGAGRTYGIGAGQMSRVDSAKIAASKAAEGGFSLDGAVMASDAFFPFRDSIDTAAERGIRAVIQPGGALRDEEVIAAADEHDIAMVLTGMRHFRH